MGMDEMDITMERSQDGRKATVTITSAKSLNFFDIEKALRLLLVRLAEVLITGKSDGAKVERFSKRKKASRV